MHGSDTAPWGYAALSTSRNSIDFDALVEADARAREAQELEPDWNALRARAEAQASEEEPEPDWNALRAQAEAQAKAASYKPPRPAPERVDPVAEARALCDQAQAQVQAAELAYQHAQSDDEAELCALHYEQAHAQLDYAQHRYEEARQAAGLKAPSAPDPIASVFASLSMAPASGLDNFASADYGTLDEVHAGKSRRAPKLMAAVAVIILGVGGVALAQFRAAEAERTARAEKLLQEMRQADAAREAEVARKAEAEKQAAIAAKAAAAPQAEAPTGESVAAALAQAVEGRKGPSAKASPVKAVSKRAQPKRRIAKRRAKKGPSKAKESGDSLIHRSKDPLYGL